MYGFFLSFFFEKGGRQEQSAAKFHPNGQQVNRFGGLTDGPSS
jgi:hypothetical protein